MKIAIDCRYTESGIGRYLFGILEHLEDYENTYFGIGTENQLEQLPKFLTPVLCETTPFSAKGLLSFPVKRVNECDAFFSPNFIIPYGIKTRIFTTIHDVLFLDYKDSNNGMIDYRIKKHFLKRAINKSEKVFTVSNFSKERIEEHFALKNGKVVVTGNAISEQLKKCRVQTKKEPHTLLFVGNLKKHKGLSVLEKAMDILNADKEEYTLKIVGTKNNFRTADNPRFTNRDDVVFTGYLDGQDLVDAISGAEFLIQPSFYEGFGITPMEALYFGTKPIISDIPVFKEIYGRFGESVAFFKTGDEKSLAETIRGTKSSISVTQDEINAEFDYADIAGKVIMTITGNIL